MNEISSLGIRRQGILLSFNAYKAKYKKFPESPADLLKVTATELTSAQFKKYQTWFFRFTGESNE